MGLVKHGTGDILREGAQKTASAYTEKDEAALEAENVNADQVLPRDGVGENSTTR